jgi:hypothetical protein
LLLRGHWKTPGIHHSSQVRAYHGMNLVKKPKSELAR